MKVLTGGFYFSAGLMNALVSPFSPPVVGSLMLIKP